MRTPILSAIFVLILSSCASAPTCRTDACYKQRLSAADPYREGEIAAWGSEKEYGSEFSETEDRQPASSKKHDHEREGH